MKYFIIKNKIAFIILWMSLQVFNVTGQENGEHLNHLHDHHKYHLGFGIAGTHLQGEQVPAPSFHLHFIRQLGEEQRWGIGLGYESIIKENLHSSINALLNYHPISFVSFNAGPGFAFGKHDGKTEVLPAFHTEAVFEFNLGGIHIGPMIGFGIDSKEYHFSVGVHVGLGF